MTVFGRTLAVATVVAALAMPAAAQQTGKDSATRMPGQGMMGQGMMGPGMQGGMMMCPGMMDMPMMQGMRSGMMMGGPGQHIEGRIAFLKTELRITPEQEELWSAYADALREAATSMQVMHDQMMSGGMPSTMPDRMQWHDQMMSSRLEALKTLRAAAVPLYNALSPEQKQTADALMMGMGMM